MKKKLTVFINRSMFNLDLLWGAFFTSLFQSLLFSFFLYYFLNGPEESVYVILLSFICILAIIGFFISWVLFTRLWQFKEDKNLFIYLIIFLTLQFIPWTFGYTLYLILRLQDTKLKYKKFSNKGNYPMVEVKDLRLSFEVPDMKERKKVIRKVSLQLHEGEVLAIIGESGSGKSVLTSALYGLAGKNSKIEGGIIRLMGEDVTEWSEGKWKKSGLRGNFISSVFQNPMTTLNPTQKIGQQLMEGLFVNNIAKTKRAAKEECLKYLRKTRIENPERVFNMYPHELSGGMKQRIVIAAILVCRPRILILDEPTTALDPTIQAQVLEIVKSLRKEFKLSIIFITHDLGVVASLADRIAIMYAGKILEMGNTKEVMLHSQHPYTWGLILSMPDLNIGKSLRSIPGSVPFNLNNIKGDPFAPRNEYALGIDKIKHPPSFKVSETHECSSWLLDPRANKFDPPVEIIKRWNRWAKIKENYDPNTHLKSYVFNKRKQEYTRIKRDSNDK